MRALILTGIVGVVGLLGLGISEAKAHGPGAGGAFHGPGGAFYYYGNGGHDLQPHWHETTTPFGQFYWFGNGPHDLRPHGHQVTPFGYESFSGGPFHRTRSFHPRYPTLYLPW